ncbi:hypothetical protein PUN28_006653 [Cardiocondyla obscurior]|uniref:Uncharacterized protein n=1 Tax=Cardiocondyla obscurior TaxID=286306 RepID=A0AAW2GET9_9HYME
MADGQGHLFTQPADYITPLDDYTTPLADHELIHDLGLARDLQQSQDEDLEQKQKCFRLNLNILRGGGGLGKASCNGGATLKIVCRKLRPLRIKCSSLQRYRIIGTKLWFCFDNNPKELYCRRRYY